MNIRQTQTDDKSAVMEMMAVATGWLYFFAPLFNNY